MVIEKFCLLDAEEFFQLGHRPCEAAKDTHWADGAVVQASPLTQGLRLAIEVERCRCRIYCWARLGEQRRNWALINPDWWSGIEELRHINLLKNLDEHGPEGANHLEQDRWARRLTGCLSQ